MFGRQLSNCGGLPTERVAELLVSSRFTDVSIRRLDDILAIQMNGMYWYDRIGPKSAYYLVSEKNRFRFLLIVCGTSPSEYGVTFFQFVTSSAHVKNF
ncbi:MAG: hypothetical protein Q4Q04_01455 [Methanocorpusculum sp.]|nr:hypothetical protein [Methanocorpusculum sp.]